jgi:hypothetical protein
MVSSAISGCSWTVREAPRASSLRRIKSWFRWQGIYRWDSAGSQCGRPLFHGLYSDERASHYAPDRSRREQIATFVTFLRSRSGFSNVLSGDQSLGVFRQWLSPPDPAINHKTARRILHSGTTKWFTENIRYKEWKATGSLLWVHGKCTSSLPSLPLLLLTFLSF